MNRHLTDKHRESALAGQACRVQFDFIEEYDVNDIGLIKDTVNDMWIPNMI